MIIDDLQKEIEDAVSRLLSMVRELTVNEYSDKCLFIPFEVTSTPDIIERREARRKALMQTTPLTLTVVMALLQGHLDNLYDVTVQVYKATADCTIIELDYVLMSALFEEYRKTLEADHKPRVHAQLRLPPDVVETNEKFDINWRHKSG